MPLRLFTGLSLGAEVQSALVRTLEELRPAAPFKWSPPENLHITTKFIGAWPEERIPELNGALASIQIDVPFRLNISHFGYLPNPHAPRHFFAAVRPSPQLNDLARRIDVKLAELGCPPEDRPYLPHVTLARIGRETGKADVQALRERIANMTDFEFGSFEVDAFHLYQSDQSLYTRLATFPLKEGSK